LARHKLSNLKVLAVGFLLLTSSIFASPAFASDPIKVGGMAQVAHTDGDKARLRNTPTTSSEINTRLSEGEAVKVYDGPRKDSEGNLWYKVRNEHGSGWMSGAYLAPTGTQASGSTTLAGRQQSKMVKPTNGQQQAAKQSSSATSIKIGATVEVKPNADNLRLRTRPASAGAVLATLDAGYKLTMLAGPVTGDDGTNWYQVKGRTTIGWVAGDYIQVSKQAVAAPAAQASKQGAPTTAAPKTTSVQPQTQVVADARSGTSRGGGRSNDDPQTRQPIASQPTSSGGVVETALRYSGYRYVFGGTSPRNGFDCSGLIYYVFNRSGIDMPRDMQGQLASGKRVSLKDLQPGDLLFFANTYKRGLSHSGLYIGDGKFIHAGNESTGVQISDVYSVYYMAHYYTAVRPGN